MRTITGAFLALIATLLMNYGSFLQKVALEELPRIGSSHHPWETIKAFGRSRTWLKGQGIQLSGAVFDNMAVGLAALSVVQPVTAAGVALLVILAITRLNEKASLLDWASISLIIIGIALLGISLTSIETDTSSPHMVLTWFFLVIGFATSAGCLYVAFKEEHKRAATLLGIGVGVLIGLTAVLQKLAWRDIGDRWAELRIASVIYSRFFWAGLALALLTLFLFQVALQRSRAIVIVPVVTGMSNVVPILIGFLAFREPLPEGGVMVFFRVLSLALILLGAVLLSLHGEAAAGQDTDVTEESQRLTG